MRRARDMTDCYRLLGVSRQASANEIRSAFIAKMKALHPDTRHGDSRADGEAGEISSAYWQLRDPARRAEHDRLLFGEAALPPPRAAPTAAARHRRKRAQPPPPALPTPASRLREASRRPRRSKRLQPLRIAAGVAACMIAAASFAIAFTYLDPQAGAQARTAGMVGAPNERDQRPAQRRRSADPALVSAAAQSFRETVRRTGLQGAHHYARQCLLELAARPSMTMLDYCIAFDARAADWERAQRARETRGRLYFAQSQRFGRYRRVARTLKAGHVRDAMLAEIAVLAANDR